MARLQPLSAEHWDDDVVRALSVMMPTERARPDTVGNMLATFVRHPKLTKAYLTFNLHVLARTTLPAHITETIVLRTATRRESRYLWDHHVPLAERAGLTESRREEIRTGLTDDPPTCAVIDAIDDLIDRGKISETHWKCLHEHLDERQVMDLVFATGCYTLLAMAIESFEIEDEH
ncbi:carboxymuconolactone decarboxylase family protein [Nocardia sp. NBC_01377]|uniref:carboxymuconolactone decarboxylase family protein n=1 Tax=Nocardia sp. NBC_01377 TaxID=2903595 RepID=UPI00324F1CBE